MDIVRHVLVKKIVNRFLNNKEISTLANYRVMKTRKNTHYLVNNDRNIEEKIIGGANI